MKTIDTTKFTLDELRMIDRALENIIEMYECHDEDGESGVDSEYEAFTRTHYKVLRSIEYVFGNQKNKK